MHHATYIYSKVNNGSTFRKFFSDIRFGINNAGSRPFLTELYKQACYLIKLTYTPSWEEKFGDTTSTLRRIGHEEFRKTARRLNTRARQIGTEADYDEKWRKKL